MQVVPEFVTKIIQIFDCKVARHGNMIVGKTGAGKSVAWQTLQKALARLKKEEPENEQYQKARPGLPFAVVRADVEFLLST